VAVLTFITQYGYGVKLKAEGMIVLLEVRSAIDAASPMNSRQFDKYEAMVGLRGRLMPKTLTIKMDVPLLRTATALP
jgi:hypothetical protein